MPIKMLLEYSSIAEVVLCAAMVVLLLRKGLVRDHPWVVALIAAHAVNEAVTVPLLFFRKAIGISLPVAYTTYFYAHWCDFFIEAVLSVLVLYAIYKTAMRPLQGLSRVGTKAFRWIVVACALLTISLVIAPSAGTSGFRILAERFQQGINVLTLCLLVFVCFSTRLLGLTYRSRTFGVTLGLGILATESLVEAAWFSTSTAHSVYSPVYFFGAATYLAALLVWGVYFAMPEPERKMVLLPTNSPFFTWNRISEALGDEPGYVAVSGFTPDMLAPAELTALTASSRFARENKLRREEAEREHAFAMEAMQSAAPFQPMAMQR